MEFLLKDPVNAIKIQKNDGLHPFFEKVVLSCFIVLEFEVFAG
jgi:hypothetical protein